MFDLDKGAKLLLELTATLGLGYSLTWLMRRQQLKKFERVGTVKELVIYPVKSCQGVYISEAECTKFGLKANGVSDSVGAGTAEGIDCGDAAAAWVCKYLGADGFRMVQYTSSLAKRNFAFEQTFWETEAKEGDFSSYTDWATYMLLTDASLEALNKETPFPVTMKSFRPNIILTETKAFDEDNWSEIRIGEQIQMRCIDACPRCVLTTVDPDKGVRRSDGEPLKTLNRIRKSAHHLNKALFGTYLAPDVCGQIKVGDPVYVLRKQLV